MSNRIIYSSLAMVIFFFLNSSCTKKDPGPLEISIATITDSLISKPISFFARVSQAPDSYTWDFGDGTTSTEINPKHIYKNMGFFNVGCIVKRNGVAYSASYRLEIKGDGRMLGQRHFYGTHTYNSANQNGTALNDVTLNIQDTTLTITAPGSFKIAVDGRLWGAWAHDTGTEILYQTVPTTTHGKVYTYLFFYPANDSVFVFYSDTDNPKFGDHQQFRLSQKK